jgi:hypothetical protein
VACSGKQKLRTTDMQEPASGQGIRFGA